jgi:hypothetical protein
MLKQETNPQKIIAIIDQLNCLLDEHEARAREDELGQCGRGRNSMVA